MKKRILTLTITASMLFGIPLIGQMHAAVEIIEQEYQNIAISVNQSTLHVTGANNQVLEIYNVAGVRVMSQKVDGNDKRIDLGLPKGCYIVKVGKVVRKISIK